MPHTNELDATEEDLFRGYQEMEADEEREKEALEWSEALIGDAWQEETTEAQAWNE